MKTLIGTMLTLFLFHSALAQDSFVIKNVTLFDGEEFHTNTSVLVEDGKISKVAKEISSNLKVIDGQHKTLLPAMSNTHVHIWAPFSLLEAAKAGVLNLFDMHSVEMAQPALKKYIDSTNYATLYTAGAAATAPDGHGTQFGFPSPTLSTPEEAKAFIEKRMVGGADYIKIIVEPWKPTLNEATITALIKETHKLDKFAVVHVSKLNDAEFVLKNKANGLVHIWWDKKIEATSLKELTSQHKFFVIPTLLTSTKALATMRPTAKEGQFLTDDELKEEVKKLYDAGVTILAGTDPPNVQINYGTDLYEELQLLNEAGLPIVDVLKSATSLPIKHFGIQHKGMIKVGYRADMILVEGDLSKDLKVLKNEKIVFKKGIAVK